MLTEPSGQAALGYAPSVLKRQIKGRGERAPRKARKIPAEYKNDGAPDASVYSAFPVPKSRPRRRGKNLSGTVGVGARAVDPPHNVANQELAAQDLAANSSNLSGQQQILKESFPSYQTMNAGVIQPCIKPVQPPSVPTSSFVSTVTNHDPALSTQLSQIDPYNQTQPAPTNMPTSQYKDAAFTPRYEEPPLLSSTNQNWSRPVSRFVLPPNPPNNNPSTMELSCPPLPYKGLQLENMRRTFTDAIFMSPFSTLSTHSGSSGERALQDLQTWTSSPVVRFDMYPAVYDELSLRHCVLQPLWISNSCWLDSMLSVLPAWCRTIPPLGSIGFCDGFDLTILHLETHCTTDFRPVLSSLLNYAKYYRKDVFEETGGAAVERLTWLRNALRLHIAWHPTLLGSFAQRGESPEQTLLRQGLSLSTAFAPTDVSGVASADEKQLTFGFAPSQWWFQAICAQIGQVDWMTALMFGSRTAVVSVCLAGHLKHTIRVPVTYDALCTDDARDQTAQEIFAGDLNESLLSSTRTIQVCSYEAKDGQRKCFAPRLDLKARVQLPYFLKISRPDTSIVSYPHFFPSELEFCVDSISATWTLAGCILHDAESQHFVGTNQGHRLVFDPLHQGGRSPTNERPDEPDGITAFYRFDGSVSEHLEFVRGMQGHALRALHLAEDSHRLPRSTQDYLRGRVQLPEELSLQFLDLSQDLGESLPTERSAMTPTTWSVVNNPEIVSEASRRVKLALIG